MFLGPLSAFFHLHFDTGFVSRQFSYHAGQVTDEHVEHEKLKSTATTRLVSQIVLSGGRSISYEYDAEERITRISDSVDGVTEYIYDAMGQLLTESVDGVVVNTMTYDNYGNILTKNSKLYTYGDSVWKDLLTSYDGQSIVYDAQGNPTSYLSHTLTWEKGRQLKSFDSNTYTYNANGIRTSKTVNGVTHTYMLNGANILREEWDDNVMIPLYNNQNVVCGILYNDIPFYFQKNQQDDIIGITNQNGDVVARYTYDAWGLCTITSDISTCSIATINPFRCRGYYFDVETGFYYLQSRYYNPSVGRFLNADIEIHRGTLGVNLYAFCENCPIIGIDANGRRTYLLNGINNKDGNSAPEAMQRFKTVLEIMGVKDVVPIPIYQVPYPNGDGWGYEFINTVSGAAEVLLEFWNIDVYTDFVVERIIEDLRRHKISSGEQINLIGYSGGGQVAVNVAERFEKRFAKDKMISNVVLIAAPIMEIFNTRAKISMIYSSIDLLSWNIGWGYDSYNVGSIGHTDYFNDQNIVYIAKLVSDILFGVKIQNVANLDCN